jgi:hypothetical protein
VPPGSYSHDDNQKRGNIAVNKSGKGVVGTKTDYVQARKKEHALANGQVLDRKGKIGISENKARCGLPRIIQRKENAPGAVRGSICLFALHLSVPFSHFFVLDHPQRQLIGGRKGASAHEQRAEQGGCPGGRKQHSDDYKLVDGSQYWVTTRKHHTGHYSGNPHNPQRSQIVDAGDQAGLHCR